MRKQHTLTVPTAVLTEFDKLPLTRSAAINQSVLNAVRDPELLVRALRLRLHSETGDDERRITYMFDTTLNAKADKLVSLTKLPKEQVVRLSMEAYIHHL